jgi:hypothetical protein
MGLRSASQRPWLGYMRPYGGLGGQASAGGGAAATYPVAILAHRQTSGTDGGLFSSGARRTVVLNEEVSDPDSIVTLSSNQFTLGAGTYIIRVHSNTNYTSRNQFWLYDVTGAADAERSQSEFAASGAANNQSYGYLLVRVTPAVDTTYEIQHRCQSSRATDGFGVAGSFDTEQYAEVIIEKVA